VDFLASKEFFRCLSDFYLRPNDFIKIKNSAAVPACQMSRGLMNILQMISKNDRYGAQRIFLDQVAVLQAMGNRVVVAGRGSEGYVTDSVRARGIPYYGSPMKGIKDIIFLRNIIKQFNINVIHITLDRADFLGVIPEATGRPVVSINMVLRANWVQVR
jgi:hypothetical protein